MFYKFLSYFYVCLLQYKKCRYGWYQTNFLVQWWCSTIIICTYYLPTCQYFETRGRRMPVPVLQVPAGEEGGPGGFPKLLRGGGWGGWGGRDGGWWWLVGDVGELEVRYSGGQPGGGGRHIGQIPLGPFSTCLLHLKLLHQGFFHQEEVKQPHCRDTHRPNIMNDLEPPEAPSHLTLTTLHCLPEYCNHCGKNF